MDDARRTLCSWGIHRHSKKIVFASSEVDFKFEVCICPYCKCPKKKTLKMLFGDHTRLMSCRLFHEIISFLENIVSGESYGENAYCYRTRIASELLVSLRGKERNKDD